MAQVTIVVLRANMEAEVSTSSLLNPAPTFPTFSTSYKSAAAAKRLAGRIWSLCENATLAVVAAWRINDLTVLRTGFSHRLFVG